MKKLLCACMMFMTATCSAWAARPDMLLRAAQALKGKTVAYVPVSMGLDITEAWVSGLRKDAETYGYTLTIRDPSWNVDAGSQALIQLIQEKPDVLIIHPPEVQVYSRLIQQAQRAGIAVITLNMETSADTAYYIGTDPYDIAAEQARGMARLCGKSRGETGKVAVMQGVLTSSYSQYSIQAIRDVFAELNGEVEIVSDQSADWDSSKARAIASVVLQANPDLCGYLGLWDNMDVGIAAAIREAGKQAQVKLTSTGGGNQDSACNNLENGNFLSYVSYQADVQAHDLMMAVRALLQNPPAKPGDNPIVLYTPLKTIEAGALRPDSCWNLQTLRTEGP